MKKVSLDYVYQDGEGRVLNECGKDDFLEVTGVDFLSDSTGRLVLMFHPKEHLHIHSPGGKAIANETTEREFRLQPIITRPKRRKNSSAGKTIYGKRKAISPLKPPK